jgi:hypothetical protein
MQLHFNSCSGFEPGIVRVDSCPPQLGKTGRENCQSLLACPIDSFPCEIYGSRLQRTPGKLKSHSVSSACNVDRAIPLHTFKNFGGSSITFVLSISLGGLKTEGIASMNA